MTDFSFTVTLKPSLYKHTADEQYDLTKNELYLMLKSISNNFTLVAEITQSCNIHYHGIIELHSKRKFHDIFRKSEIYGFQSTREIYDKAKWIEYISKDLANTYKSIDRRPIINDDYKIYNIENKLLYGTTY